MRKNFWLVSIGLVLYCGIIFFLSSIPGSSIPALPLILRKLIHFFLYVGLGLIFTYFLSDLKADLTQVAMGIATFLFTAVYASSDEIHQSFTPGRDFDVLDIVLDTLGGFTGWLLFSYLSKRLIISSKWQFKNK